MASVIKSLFFDRFLKHPILDGLMSLLCGVFLISGFINTVYIPMTWEKVPAVVVNRSIMYMGEKSTYSRSRTTTYKVYNGTVDYKYLYEGEEFERTTTIELRSEGIEDFEKRYFQGATITIKVAPHNRSTAIVDINLFFHFVLPLLLVFGGCCFIYNGLKKKGYNNKSWI